MTIPRPDARVRTITVGLSLALAAVLLFFSLRGIEWREVGRTIAGASPGRIAVVLAISSFTVFLRACRWYVLLRSERLSIATVFWATAAGYFGNNFLPARAGELVRTMMISARSGLDVPYVLATALCERVSDAVVLVGIAGAILLTMPAPPGWLANAIRPIAVVAVVGAAGIVLLPFSAAPLRAVMNRLPLPERLRVMLSEAVENALRGMRALHDPRRLLPFAALTAVIWTLDAGGVIVGAAALGLEVSLPVAFLLLASLGLGSALPSTPGYVGIYQFVAVSVLMPFGFSRNDAIAYILLAQALSYVVIGFWGALGLIEYRRDRAAK